MGSLSLITNSSTSYDTLFNSSSTQQPTQQTTTQAAAQQDTVKLSDKAQAQLLHQQGESVSAIASSLGVTKDTVDSYLNITVDAELEKTIEAASQLSA